MCVSPYLGVLGEGGLPNGPGHNLLMQLISLSCSKMEICETYFFDIVTIQNDQISYAKHVSAPLYVFFTLFGCQGRGGSPSDLRTTCLCSFLASAAQKWSLLSLLRGAHYALRAVAALYGPIGAFGDLWGPMWDLWGHLGTCGDLWGPLGTYGALWGPIKSYGDLWGAMGTYGGLCGPMRTYRGLWGAMGTCGRLVGPTGNYGDLWWPMGAYGDLWGPMGAFGDLWGPMWDL